LAAKLEALRSTTELSESGREGNAGVAVVPIVFADDDDDDGMAAEGVDVGIAAEAVRAV
jgi:hypothetical protein